jgi:hypothetical protein
MIVSELLFDAVQREQLCDLFEDLGRTLQLFCIRGRPTTWPLISSFANTTSWPRRDSSSLVRGAGSLSDDALD